MGLLIQNDDIIYRKIYIFIIINTSSKMLNSYRFLIQHITLKKEKANLKSN
jgi:lipid-A-disaccharide synthase-like uncharacterized protein